VALVNFRPSQQMVSTKPQENRSRTRAVSYESPRGGRTGAPQGLAAAMKRPALAIGEHARRLRRRFKTPGRGPGGRTSIAVEQHGQHIVGGYNDTRGCSLNPISVSGVMYSDDGGKTWVDADSFPRLKGTRFRDPTSVSWGCKFRHSSILSRLGPDGCSYMF